MDRNISEQLSALPRLAKSQLITQWCEHFGDVPPPHLRKQLMVPILAYRIQEREYGGLSQAARKRLRDIGQSLAQDKRPERSILRSLKTGTRLIRSWQGEVHEVSVTDDGFKYRGQLYGSLSEIAREITGARWSGPLFFGTSKGTTKQVS